MSDWMCLSVYYLLVTEEVLIQLYLFVALISADMTFELLRKNE